MNIVIKSWVIMAVQGPDKGMFWSNDQGWVTHSDATTFTPEERATFNLPGPPGGAYWIPNEVDPLSIKTVKDLTDYLGHFPHDLPITGNSRGMSFNLNFNIGYTTPYEKDGNYLYDLANEHDEGANTTLEVSLEPS